MSSIELVFSKAAMEVLSDPISTSAANTRALESRFDLSPLRRLVK
jgi:hypothetical protein